MQRGHHAPKGANTTSDSASQALHHGVRFANSITQTDGENAITELAQQAAQQLSLPTRQSPTYDHRSQGAVERFHQTLFAQLRATRFFSIGITSWTATSQPTSCFSTMASSTQHLHHQPLPDQEQRPDILRGQLWIQLYSNFGEIVYAGIKRIDNRKLGRGGHPQRTSKGHRILARP